MSIFDRMNDKSSRVKIGETNVVAHIIVWAVIFMFPVLLNAILFGSDFDLPAYKRYFVMVSCDFTLFYLNYCFLINRYLFTRKLWKFVFLNAFALFTIQGVEHILGIMIQNPNIEGLEELFTVPFRIVVVFSGLLIKIITILVATTMKGTNRVYLETHQKEVLEKEKKEAELKYLKDKLNPHFLFNALNIIYALTAFDSEKAQAAIDSLSKLLRYVLYENDSDMVPLEGELEFTNCYIDLMALRLDPSRTTMSVDIDQAPVGNYHIATLLFMTLIENAFKHGVSSREKSYINISIKNETRNDENWIVCKVSNSLFPKTESDKSGSGIGLENLQQRLEILYKDEHNYQVTTTDTDYSAVIEIPLKHIHS